MSPSAIVVMVASACCVALLLLLLARLAGAAGALHAAAAQPPDRVPLFWRLFNLPIVVLSHAIKPWLSARSRFSCQQKLKQGDLDGVLGSEAFVAGRLLAGLLFALAAIVVWSPRGIAPLWLIVAAVGLGVSLPSTWLRDRIEQRRRSILRQLPFYLDVITLAVESGLNLNAALIQAVEKGPRGALSDEFGRTLSELRTGRSREQALRALAERLALPAIGSLVAALLVAEKQGASLGPVLRAQAEQRRSERFMRAEKLAMQAPVKMLPPLLLFIFPCTFAMLLFPVASRLIEEGWLR